MIEPVSAPHGPKYSPVPLGNGQAGFDSLIDRVDTATARRRVAALISDAS